MSAANEATIEVKRCSWNTEDDAVMLDVLRQNKEAGKQSGAGWKQCVWTECKAALAVKGSKRGAPKTAAKCSDHWTNLKGNFVDLHFIRTSCSGFGWNEATKIVEAPDNVWAALLAVCTPRRAIFQGKSLKEVENEAESEGFH
ncbi:hypothetical protein D9619_013493 [Psilocybe cf. subviscida]|uniref:Myb/SANT-like domain-containing protein n=1 Tax=Psilocybe cf. subviscida TaxID=2480587 RepID=A0A8H5F4S7_9AGAR|nr:hypothetical protein D9619_013493 [Psilocybe cf. subviscida]